MYTLQLRNCFVKCNLQTTDGVRIRIPEYRIEDVAHNVSGKTVDENVLRVLLISREADYLIIVPKGFATFNLALCIF